MSSTWGDRRIAGAGSRSCWRGPAIVTALGLANRNWMTGSSYSWDANGNPNHARFLNQDPIGFAGGTNLYGYARNCPASYVDPSGLAFFGLSIGGVEGMPGIGGWGGFGIGFDTDGNVGVYWNFGSGLGFGGELSGGPGIDVGSGSLGSIGGGAGGVVTGVPGGGCSLGGSVGPKWTGPPEEAEGGGTFSFKALAGEGIGGWSGPSVWGSAILFHIPPIDLTYDPRNPPYITEPCTVLSIPGGSPGMTLFSPVPIATERERRRLNPLRAPCSVGPAPQESPLAGRRVFGHSIRSRLSARRPPK